jgi:hypothetical protein
MRQDGEAMFLGTMGYLNAMTPGRNRARGTGFPLFNRPFVLKSVDAGRLQVEGEVSRSLIDAFGFVAMREEGRLCDELKSGEVR